MGEHDSKASYMVFNMPKVGTFGIRAVQLLRKMFTGHLAVHLNRFRYYPAIMRTTTMDPLGEKYYDISPYAWSYKDKTSIKLKCGRSWLNENQMKVKLRKIDGETFRCYVSTNGDVLTKRAFLTQRVSQRTREENS